MRRALPPAAYAERHGRGSLAVAAPDELPRVRPFSDRETLGPASTRPLDRDAVRHVERGARAEARRVAIPHLIGAQPAVLRNGAAHAERLVAGLRIDRDARRVRVLRAEADAGAGAAEEPVS